MKRRVLSHGGLTVWATAGKKLCFTGRINPEELPRLLQLLKALHAGFDHLKRVRERKAENDRIR